MDRSTTKPLTGTFFYILLALIDADRYGLGIVQEIERRTNGEVQLGPGTLYNAIKKMLEAGLIVEATPAPDGTASDPRRRYYGVTEHGRDVFYSESRRLERIVEAAKAKTPQEAER